jgi:hypothetical protein
VLADLHIHTVLSPCAEVEMIPPLIVRRAQELGLGLIAITDHNACDNASAVQEAARGSGVTVLPGLELQTREEVHILCLFFSSQSCRQWHDHVQALLPDLPNDEDHFGPQFVVDATGEWARTEERLLAASADLTVEEAVQGVHSLGGLAIAAHVDRPSYSLISNLGFIPQNFRADALEVTPRFVPSTGYAKWPQLADWPLVVSSDAHRLCEMQRRTLFRIADPKGSDLPMALRGEGGRSARVHWPAA